MRDTRLVGAVGAVRVVRAVRLATGVVASGLLVASNAVAAEPPSAGPGGPANAPLAAPSGAATSPSTPSTPPSPEKLEEAKQRYQRGLQLYNEQNFEAARVEFERAYQLAPTYKILYNIGLAYEQIGDYVQALTTLQRYLDLGGAELSDERRSEIAKELAQIRPRVARISVRTNVTGAEILVDDQCGSDVNTGNVTCGAVSGTSRDVLVNPGRRRVLIRREGYLPDTVLVTVAGSDTTEVVVRLKELPKGYVEKDPWPRNRAIIAWGVTAALAGTSVVMGVVALGAEDDLKKQRDEFGVAASSLDDAGSKAQTFSILCDVFAGAAIVGGIVSTYFTVKAFDGTATEKERKTGSRSNPSQRVQFGLGRAGFGGTF